MKPLFAQVVRKQGAILIALSAFFSAGNLLCAQDLPPLPGLAPVEDNAPAAAAPPLPSLPSGEPVGAPAGLPPAGGLPPLPEVVPEEGNAAGAPAPSLPPLPGGEPVDVPAGLPPLQPVEPVGPVSGESPDPEGAAVEPLGQASSVPSGLNLPPVTDNAGLLRLLDEIRVRSRRGDYLGAQALTEQTIQTFAETSENAFYLRQVRREQTNLYYRMAHQALKDKKYSLASQYLAQYQKNVTREVEERKKAREVRIGKQGKHDVSLVGKLVEELDQAKKELAEIRAKAGLPESDAKVDYDRVMAQEQLELVTGETLMPDPVSLSH